MPEWISKSNQKLPMPSGGRRERKIEEAARNDPPSGSEAYGEPDEAEKKPEEGESE